MMVVRVTVTVTVGGGRGPGASLWRGAREERCINEQLVLTVGSSRSLSEDAHCNRGKSQANLRGRHGSANLNAVTVHQFYRY